VHGRYNSVSAILANLLLFGRILRLAGLDIHHGRLIDAIRALDWIGVRSRDDVRAALRALLVHRKEDLGRFELAFDLYFRADHSTSSSLPRFPSIGDSRPRANAAPELSGGQLETAATDSWSTARLAFGAYSAFGALRTKDFAEFTPLELEQARVLLTLLPWQLGLRRRRRWERSSGSALDLRAMLRRDLMRGDLLDLPRRRRRTAPRPLVVIGDVSGSMERYSRVLLHFAYGLATSTRQVESFVFATELTRITRRIARQGDNADLASVLRDVNDWGGGTRIGEALRTFNTCWTRRVMRNGPIVLIVSDGWDRGDPVLLARELARLRRSSRRLIWLNPLLGSATYEPLTRGMQAALRHIDDFLPSHNLASLEHLAEHLRSLSARPRIRDRRSSQSLALEHRYRSDRGANDTLSKGDTAS
jgi:uncharacterized protein